MLNANTHNAKKVTIIKWLALVHAYMLWLLYGNKQFLTLYLILNAKYMCCTVYALFTTPFYSVLWPFCGRPDIYCMLKCINGMGPSTCWWSILSIFLMCNVVCKNQSHKLFVICKNIFSIESSNTNRANTYCKHAYWK